MFDGFDDALSEAFSSSSALYGRSQRSRASAAARRASAENMEKAIAEASAGRVGFAALHDTASRRYREDADLIARGSQPVHHPVAFYLSFATAQARRDGESAPASTGPMPVTSEPRRPLRSADAA